MEKQILLDRITINPKVMVGKPTIRGLRITVEQILKALASGVSTQELLEDYPELEPEDIQALSVKNEPSMTVMFYSSITVIDGGNWLSPCTWTLPSAGAGYRLEQ